MTKHRSILAFLIALLGATAARGDSISIKASVQLETAGPITLAMIADLDGPHATRLAQTVLVAAPADLPIAGSPGTRRLTLRAIRERLDSDPGVNWAFLSLRGRDVSLRLPGTSTPTDRTDSAQPDAQKHVASPPPPPGSVGDFARGVVRSILRIADADLRIVWPERSAGFLAEPVGDRTLHVQPIGTSDRMPLSFTIYDGDRIVRTEHVRATITVRRTVRIVAKPLRRGTELTPTDYTTRTAWVGPGVEPATDITDQITARKLEPGSIIEGDDITPPLVIERGELIVLHCISGAVAIRSPARALGDARDGETVSVEMESTGRRVLARANGKGTAVLVVRATPTPAGGQSVPPTGVGTDTETQGKRP